jgi:transcriptional regulator with XRE-family HTH domain
MKSIHDQSYKLLISLLREERRKQKLTQAELAERIDSDQTYVSKVETMERRIDVIELRTFCKALDIDLLNFLKDFEDRLKDSLEEKR